MSDRFVVDVVPQVVWDAVANLEEFLCIVFRRAVKQDDLVIAGQSLFQAEVVQQETELGCVVRV
jgi:hypothetical protein